MKISLFSSSGAYSPSEHMTMDTFLDKVEEGEWKKQVLAVRAKTGQPLYKKVKGRLPAVTCSGYFKSRDKHEPLNKRLKAHSGFICIDVDIKDNPKMRTKDLVDKDCYAQFASCGGEGIKIIYRCKTTKDAAEHRRIYDAVVKRLEAQKIVLKPDPIVKSIASLQYVSFDPNMYRNPKTKLVIKPLPPIKKERKKPSKDALKDLAQLEEYVAAMGKADPTKTYEDWLLITFGLTYSLGEAGRGIYHKISQNYKDYSKAECDEKYDTCLETVSGHIEKPITLATVYQIINKVIPKVTLRKLNKKYIQSHAVAGVGEDAAPEGDGNSDLEGLVRYKLFLFKKKSHKGEDGHEQFELVPEKLNLNEFEVLLKEMGFARHGKLFVRIVNNIVDEVDIPDVLRIVTERIEADGDYVFFYGNSEHHFSWEEIAHKWREIRALGTTANQIAASLPHWHPKLLKDTVDVSYIPYQNGVLKVTAKGFGLVPYHNMDKQIWRERILPRDFEYTKTRGMFEEFFINVCGRGSKKEKSDPYFRALWYYGYLLQGTKRQSTARAWVLYDVRPGNNGRSGKTIIGNAAGKIRNVAVIDGKRVDLENRFAFQTIKPWTDIVFIDDPRKGVSIVPLFNMISGQMEAEAKGQDPIITSLKFLIASNWVMESENTSESGRQFITQLDDHYVRYAEEKKTITPLVDLHGKEFFTDWDKKDWAAFDSFSVRALQYHLGHPAPENVITGNTRQIRFLQLNEEELFFELCLEFVRHVQAVKKGGLVIPQKLLTMCIQQSNDRIKNNTAGRIAQQFLLSIKFEPVRITSYRNAAGMPQMAYAADVQYKDLDFGKYAEQLPKPSNL